MSSDHFSDKPLPPAKSHCPYCGEDIAATARACWLCLQKYAIQEGEPTAKVRGQAASDKRPAGGDSGAWAALGILAVLLIGALAFETPGLLIILVILAAPALARAAVSASRDTEQAPSTLPNFVLMFFNSLGIAALVGLASFVAFFATCFVICLGGLGVGALDKRGSEDSLLACSVGGGSIVGLVVFVLLFRAFWPKKGEG